MLLFYVMSEILHINLYQFLCQRCLHTKMQIRKKIRFVKILLENDLTLLSNIKRNLKIENSWSRKSI